MGVFVEMGGASLEPTAVGDGIKPGVTKTSRTPSGVPKAVGANSVAVGSATTCTQPTKITVNEMANHNPNCFLMRTPFYRYER